MSHEFSLYNQPEGFDASSVQYERLLKWVERLDRQDREKLFRHCIKSLETFDLSTPTIERVIVVRYLVALLPMSLDEIQRALRRFDRVIDYEIHFTLFCYLHWAGIEDRLMPFADRVVSMVGAYLISVPRETALASWMAGHMLGSHWAGGSAAQTLMCASLIGQYAPGRYASVSALGELIRRTSEAEDNVRRAINRCLRIISSNDKSRRIRNLAAKVGRNDR